jgi:hypothetical protein
VAVAVSDINPPIGGYADIIGIAVWPGLGHMKGTNSDATRSRFWRRRVGYTIWKSAG